MKKTNKFCKVITLDEGYLSYRVRHFWSTLLHSVMYNVDVFLYYICTNVNEVQWHVCLPV